MVPALCHRVGTRLWLIAEEPYEEAATWGYPTQRNKSCRNSFKNMRVYFTSLLKGLSEVPHTI